MSDAKTPAVEPAFVARIAEEVGCRPAQVQSACGLLAEGATVPFIARYRKEATGGLADDAIETVARRREYFLDLAARRDAILESIAAQEKLTPELEAAIRAAGTKQELEDLYLPYKPKRRTRGQKAREAGLEPLAAAIVAGVGGAADPAALAAPFVDAERGVADVAAALAGAADIIAEDAAERPESRARLRRGLGEQGALVCRVKRGKKEAEGAAVFRDWFDHREPAARVKSHRLLAMLRGEREGILALELETDDEAELGRLKGEAGARADTACGRLVGEAVADGYARLLRPSIEKEVLAAMRERAEAEAVAVFRANLEALLLQAPLGQLPVLGLDPGLRTGCKLACVDATGRVVATGVIRPIPPNAEPERAAARIVELVRAHGVRAIAIGNGTGGRETELFCRKAATAAGLGDVIVAIVPETGASVYSASATARDELPDLDVSLRGAVSIARRLQDPLAELVKIEPRSLGVGQYQHDVDQKALAGQLDAAVVSVVNRVGVELNSASAALLARVSGLSPKIAKSVVAEREARGRFGGRRELLKVAGVGPRTFEQAAGFLRIRDASHPLDRTGVHPERYALVEAMAAALGVSLEELVGHPEVVARLDLDRFADATGGVGRFTLDDIRAELERPGRDPRPEFEAPSWRDDLTSIEDLREGMVLEGRVSNVTNFGAFVDLGVKRDGLVHVSELSHQWLDDPRAAVSVGDVVRVKVIEVDLERGRVGLSIKALTEPPKGTAAARRPDARGAPRGESPPRQDRGRRGGDGGGASRPSRPERPEAKPPDRLHTMDDLLRKWGRKH